MNDSDNINNNDEGVIVDQMEQQVEPQHQEQQQRRIIAVAAAKTARAKQRLRLHSILDSWKECPFRTRYKIDKLVEEYLCKIEVEEYDLSKLKDNNDANYEQQQQLTADSVIVDSDSDVDVDNSDSDIDDEEEEEEDSGDESDVSADTMIARASNRTDLISSLEQYEERLLRTRNKMDEFTEEYLSTLENDVHTMICDQNAGVNY